MDDYLSRQELLNKAEYIEFFTGDDYDGLSLIKVNDIKNAPAADVEPVIHGHWILHRQFPFSRQWRCSKCGYIRELSPGIVLPKACENCRAKMDEGEL